MDLRHGSRSSSRIVLALVLCLSASPSCSPSPHRTLAETERLVAAYRQAMPRLHKVAFDRSTPTLKLRHTAYLENGELRCLEEEGAEPSGVGSFEQSFFEHDSLISFSSTQTFAEPGRGLVRLETELRFDPQGRVLDARVRRESRVASLPASNALWLRRHVQMLASAVREDIAKQDSPAPR